MISKKRLLALSVPLVIAITGVFAFLYFAVQQEYRQSLNDPQIQLAEDVSQGLMRGAIPSFSGPKVNISKSLAAWIAVYDASSTPLLYTGELNSAPPELPAGLLNESTW